MIKFVSIPKYAEMADCSQAIVKQLISKGELVTSTTDGGYQIRIKVETDPNLDELKKEMEHSKKMLQILCKHFGVSGTG